MPETVVKPQKRVLGDTRNRPNLQPPSPASAKKRKLEGDRPGTAAIKPSAAHNGFRKPATPASSQSQQPKSQFEEEVLEKLTQDINSLKESNSEKDQQWERPALGDFDGSRDTLCFQQIEAEEGTLGGGKTTVKLFGVTEVCVSVLFS